MWGQRVGRVGGEGREEERCERGGRGSGHRGWKGGWEESEVKRAQANMSHTLQCKQ